MPDSRPHALVLYHYFYPDDVISARHFDGLAQGLAARGWRVTAAPSNRGCRDESRRYPLQENWDGISIRRVWRPALKQASNFGRIANALWMIGAWGLRALEHGERRPDVVIVGTDPVLSPLVAPIWKLTRPGVVVAHWCFDLYPEAPVADGLLRHDSLAVRFIKRLLRTAYRRCDLHADLGGCMQSRLAEYKPGTKQVTLVPWALVEPPVPPTPDPATRRELFGEAALGILYSGNFGRAHSYAEFLALARALRGESAAMCFAVRGNRADELRREVTPEDANIRFAGFAPESELEKRLGSADVHLVSLRPEWTGIVVPSKFFGSLAAGRPIIFAGDPKSAQAIWVRKHNVGWLLTAETVPQVAQELRDLSRSPERLAELQRRCHRVYHERFSQKHVVDEWDKELRALLSRNR
jgi:putative colanic acid biosynthesis glycosyltransferase WcaI